MSISSTYSRIENGIWTGYLLAVVVFIALPLLAVILASFHNNNVLSFPFEFTTEWYLQLLNNGGARDSYINSLSISIPVTIISSVVGTAAAIGYTRYEFPYQEQFKIFALLPIFFPLLVLGLGMSLWFNFLGVPLGVTASVIGQIAWITPIVMFVVSIQALKIAPNIEEAAEDLGAETYQMYRDISLPLMKDSIISGTIFAFILSWNNYYISTNLTGANSTITTWIHGQIQFGFTPLVPAGAAVGFYVTLFILLFFVLRRLL